MEQRSCPGHLMVWIAGFRDGNATSHPVRPALSRLTVPPAGGGKAPANKGNMWYVAGF
jgi:hypothetical protein